MALIEKLEMSKIERPKVHNPVDCTYFVFTGGDGQKYIQLNTYGSKARKIPGKESQTIQFGPEAIRALREILQNEV